MLNLVLYALIEALRAGICGVQIDGELKAVFQKEFQLHKADKPRWLVEFDEKIQIIHLSLATRRRTEQGQAGDMQLLQAIPMIRKRLPNNRILRTLEIGTNFNHGTFHAEKGKIYLNLDQASNNALRELIEINPTTLTITKRFTSFTTPNGNTFSPRQLQPLSGNELLISASLPYSVENETSNQFIFNLSSGSVVASSVVPKGFYGQRVMSLPL